MQFSRLTSSRMFVPLPSSRCLAEGNRIFLMWLRGGGGGLGQLRLARGLNDPPPPPEVPKHKPGSGAPWERPTFCDTGHRHGHSLRTMCRHRHGRRHTRAEAHTHTSSMCAIPVPQAEEKILVQFHINGLPLLLQGVAETSSLEHRAAALRQYLTRCLTPSTFDALYKLMTAKGPEADPVAVMADAVEVAGGQHQPFVPLIEQLLYAEGVLGLKELAVCCRTRGQEQQGSECGRSASPVRDLL